MTEKKKVVAGLCLDADKRMLCIFSKGAWYHPGGRVEEGETDEECLIRELKEELGIEVLKEELKYYTTLEGTTHGQGIPISLAFYFFEYKENVSPNNEVLKVEWLKPLDIRDGRPITPLMAKITDKLENEGYI